jgi:hypothetical protein
MVQGWKVGRRVAVVVGMALVASTGLAPVAGAAAVPPNPPGSGNPALSFVGNCGIKADWTAPSSGEPPTSYVVNLWSLPRVDDRYGLPVDLKQAVVAAPTTEHTFTGLSFGRTYNITVSSLNAIGSSQDTVLGSVGPVTDGDACQGVTPTRPFADDDWAAVIVRTYKEFLGRTPSASELASARASITAGSPIPAVLKERRSALALQLAEQAERWDGPAYRLYSAYFLREPELGGLTYWSAKLRAGTSVKTVSAYFAGSSEFRNTYGSLDDAKFVTLIYRNVLDRAPEPAGFRYWVGQLQAGRTSRAAVMIGFSESSEHRTRLAFRLSTTVAYVHMLKRMPTPAELQQAAVFRLDHPGLVVGSWFGVLYWQIVDSSAYRARGTTP